MNASLPLLVLLLALATVGCQGRPADQGASEQEEEEGWAVTAWGDRYEIFAEADPLVVGQISKSHTHVTILDEFPPLKEGAVSAVLRDPQGGEQIYRQEKALRDGIYSIEIKPSRPGIFDLFFRVESTAGLENIAAGQVRVGEGDSLGGLVKTPQYGPPGTVVAETPSGEPISFLKEQQWRTPFATEWARQGTVHRTASGPARIRPAAGGEALLIAPLDGIVAATTRAYVGMDVARGAGVISLTPRVASDRSLSQIRSELQLARARLARLEELLKLEAVSAADVEEARARVSTLTSEQRAIGGEGTPVSVRAPIAGRIAELSVVPGQAVTAGTALARVVRTNPLWVEVSLSPADAGALGHSVAGLVLHLPGDQPPLTLGSGEVRLVSGAPEVDRTTGSINAIIEVRTSTPLRPGMAVTADVLLAQDVRGIVVPTTAVIDDGGVPVVYLQLDGESFVRQEVRVTATQGDRVLVSGISEWNRVVTRGGAAIRRAALLRSGPPEGHVH